MGQQVSTYPQRPPMFPVFSLTFRADTIKVLDASPEVIEIVRAVIAQYYTRGIQKIFGSESGNAVHFKLNGYPFFINNSKEDAIMLKRMMCVMMESLRNAGWELTLSSDLSRQYDFSTLFFQQVPVAGYDGCKIICLSLSAYDKLQLVNAPPEASQILLECAGELLQKPSRGDDYFEVQLLGNLWASYTSESGFLARNLLLNCFSQFHRLRYRYYGTANMKGTADSIFFISDAGDLGPREYCFLSLNCNDRIRLINAPDDVVQTVGSCLEQHWTRGIQNAEPKKGGIFFEYKLRGYPWLSSGIDAVESRFLITVMLQKLVEVGWAVVTALDVSRRPNDKAVFLLRRCATAKIPHFAICPAEYDKIRIINADKEMVDLIRGIVHANWTVGIQKEGLYGNSFELKMAGYPWVSSNYGGMFELSRMMMGRMLYELAKRGWRVICSADVSSKYHSDSNGGSHYALDVHSWIVAYTGHGLAPDQAAQFVPVSGSAMPAPPSYSISASEPPPSYKEVMKGAL